MLIVVTIIGILAALLSPSLQLALGNARGISCLNNLKQIGTAHQLFPGDHNGELTPAVWVNESDWSGTWVSWAGFLTGYNYLNPPRIMVNAETPGEGQSVLRCPLGTGDAFAGWDRWDEPDRSDVFRPARSRIEGVRWWEGLPGDVAVWYAMNGANCVGSMAPTWRVGPDDYKPRNYNDRPRWRNLKHPSQLVANFDGAWPEWYGSLDPKYIARRHGVSDASNLLFWDGHARQVKTPELPYPGISWWAGALNDWNPRIKWLFSGSIRDNIAYGKPGATDEEIEKAAKAAHIHHFISTQPLGYDTPINEEASNISQGQKQLLTIARAMLADSPILILDEATSSVDTRTERQIQSAMAALMKGRTSFVIAHRLSTIKDADHILVMEHGDIVEQGTHEDLLALGGHYADLYNSQFA